MFVGWPQGKEKAKEQSKITVLKRREVHTGGWRTLEMQSGAQVELRVGHRVGHRVANMAGIWPKGST